uniref:NADH-ubiquinone oxidoreductase chain 1 n=1 Tax=Pectinatella magnifica TaxID=350071 RepID=A0A344AUX5_9BILA|nr:NADH dehydrogenase subunit 1 [Pectinatella magnifica]AWX65972.1 NADH dehydrogenase subunit 1 [Pectinatella magnifica]
MVSFLIKDLIVVVAVLLAVAFFTLIERKVLGYIQLRKGPNKVGFIGLPQPFADAIKLFTKENSWVVTSNILAYKLAPIMSLMLALILWVLYFSPFSAYFVSLGVLLFLCISSMNVYTTLLSGWSSNSKYALLGALRAIAQTISYEVSMALLLMSVAVIFNSYNTWTFSEGQISSWTCFFLTPLAIMWFISSLAETNRAPFDFAEGESELVSGFNVEYGGSGFAFLFMAEYANILFMSMLTSVLFLGGPYFMGFDSSVVCISKVVSVSILFLWVRGSFPRLRYDQLMYLTWKGFLVMVLSYLLILLPLESVVSTIW